jgi:uncharacterized glyoxalase superfamily protein PhnB
VSYILYRRRSSILLEPGERLCYTLPNMKPAANTVLLELHVPDFEKVKDYYGKLSFEVLRETQPAAKNGDIESYYSRVKDVANIVAPLDVRPWGLRDFRIEDPFGYYIRITALHNILDGSVPFADG